MSNPDNGHDMAWYFDRGLERGAVLLDGANLSKDAFPLFDAYKQELYLIAEGKGLELGYSAPGGQSELRRLIAQHQSYLEERSFTKDNVVVNSGGCSGTFDNLFRVLKSESIGTDREEIIIPVPFYSEIGKSVLFNRLKPVFVETDRANNFQPTAKDIEHVLSKKTLAVFLTNPGNPACNYISPEAIREISYSAKGCGSYLIMDSIFEESPGTATRPAVFDLAEDYERLIKITGFSKDRPQLNDLRLGMSISLDPKINQLLVQAAEVSDFSSSTIAERIAMADMDLRVKLDSQNQADRETDPKLERYVLDIQEYHAKIKKGMEEAISILGSSCCIDDFIRPEAGNVVFARVKDGLGIADTHELFMSILTRGNILVSPGKIFKAPRDELWYRTTMSVEPDIFADRTRKLLTLVEEIAC